MGSTRKIYNLGETIKNMSYTPPSLMKATPITIASESNDVSTVSVSEAGDVMMMSSNLKENVLKKTVSYLIKTHLRAKPLP